MRYTIDRFEGNYAVVILENMSTENIPINALPPSIKEGDIITVLIDEDETLCRKERIGEKLSALFE